MGGVAAWADDGIRNADTASAGDGDEAFVVSPKIVIKQKTPVLFLELFDDRQAVGLELLVIRRVGIVEGKLTERDKFYDKFDKIKNCLVQMLNV